MQSLIALAEWFCFRCFNVFSLYCFIPIGTKRGFLFKRVWIPFAQECFVLSLVEIGQVIQGNKIFEKCRCVFAILILSSLAKGCGPSIEQLSLVPVTPGLVQSDQVVLETRISKRCQCIFSLISDILFPWKKS